VSTATTPYTLGLLWLATAVLFGIRRPAAAAYAGIASAITPVIIGSGFHWWSWVPSWLSWNGTKDPEIPLILFGTGAILLARSPDGWIAQGARQRWERARRRAARQAARLAAQPELALAGIPGTGVETNGLISDPSTELSTLALSQQVALADEAEALATVHRREGDLVASGAVHARSDTGPEEPGFLDLRDLRVGYGDVEVLHGINLAIPAGKITALFGANGGGKSTLCNTVAGLITPTSGTMTLDGREISHVPAHRRVGMGMLVAPESRGIFPGLTVQENLELRLNSDERNAAYERFPRLGERHNQTAGSLSGGEQQMLALAPLLVRPPRLVVADEPTLGLAPLIIAQLMELFTELREAGTAILVVEEKVRDVLPVADRVAFIELGHIVWSGERSELDDEQLTNIYLGSAL
jgi:ABC-type branched-subunit amino acid transport system ATPase component